MIYLCEVRELPCIILNKAAEDDGRLHLRVFFPRDFSWIGNLPDDCKQWVWIWVCPYEYMPEDPVRRGDSCLSSQHSEDWSALPYSRI